MQRILRVDEEGVASAVASMFVLLAILVFLQVAVIGAVPAQQYAAEYATSRHDIQQMNVLRSIVAGPTMQGAQLSVPFQLGTQPASIFASPSTGTLTYAAGDTSGLSLAFGFVPQFHQAAVRKVDQDVILLMDDSGSMAWNDPQNLRIKGAQEYVGRLTPPDCVAIVAFNGRSYLTQANVGGTPHHLTYPGMCGDPTYNQPILDLGTITDIDSTNIGLAIQLGNTELVQNGHAKKAWVEILLTDGQNECSGSASPCGDTFTIQMAQAAKADNITIFTIGLSSSADASLLTQIASITGGTYYAAPTAASIRWIYFEISMHYQSSVSCGTLSVAEAYGGALSLDLHNAYFPAQTLRLDAGGISVNQSGGASMETGLPMTYISDGGGSGIFRASVITLTGDSFQVTASDTHVVSASILAHQVVDQVITKIDLGTEANAVSDISSTLEYWTQQGAATQAGANAVIQPLNASQDSLQAGAANMSTGNPIGASFDVDRAQGYLTIALNATETQRKAGAIQDWLAKQTEDAILLEGCRVEQWANWYDGLTITITTPIPGAWAMWFNTTLPSLGVPFTLGYSGRVVVVTLHALDRIITDRRVVSLSGI